MSERINPQAKHFSLLMFSSSSAILNVLWLDYLNTLFLHLSSCKHCYWIVDIMLGYFFPQSIFIDKIKTVNKPFDLLVLEHTLRFPIIPFLAVPVWHDSGKIMAFQQLLSLSSAWHCLYPLFFAPISENKTMSEWRGSMCRCY